MTGVALDGRVIDILLELLDSASFNPRKTFDEAKLHELASSIRAQGIIQPLLVRPRRRVTVQHEDGSFEETPFQAPELSAELLKRQDVLRTEVEDRYEIVCGHRRSEAATLAGRVDVPCLVRNMSDEEAHEQAITDNLQRVDVSAIEEAEGFGELLQRLGSIAAVAAVVGKEQSYVAKRLKLLTLSTVTIRALSEMLITVDHALLLCRLAEEEQNEILKWCLDTQAGKKVDVEVVLQQRIDARKPDKHSAEHGARPSFRREWEPQTVQRLKEHIECESGMPLDRAPWPMDEDWLLPDVGSCLDCPQNTHANAPLFDDLDMRIAICTDGGCFKAKTAAFVLHGIGDARKVADVKLPVLRVSWKHSSSAPRMEKNSGGPSENQVFCDGQWVEAKKKCEHMRASVTMDWSDSGDRGYMGGSKTLRRPGEIVQACVEPTCKIHPKEWAKPKQKPASSAREKTDPEAQKRAKEAAEFREGHEKKIQADVFAAIVPKLTAVETVRYCASTGWNADVNRKEVRKDFPKATDEQIDCIVMLGNEDVMPGYINGDGLDTSQRVTAIRKALWEFAKRFGVDADAIAAAHFHAEGGLAPSAEVLYPKGFAWPNKNGASPATKADTKKPVAKTAKKTPIKSAAKKSAPKKAVKKAAKKAPAKKAKGGS